MTSRPAPNNFPPGPALAASRQFWCVPISFLFSLKHLLTFTLISSLAHGMFSIVIWFLSIWAFSWVFGSYLNCIVVREHTLRNFRFLAFEVCCAAPTYSVLVSVPCALKGCVFCSCYTHCSSRSRWSSFDHIIFHSPAEFFGLVILSVWERGIKISNCDRRFICFSLSSVHFFAHDSWSPVVRHTHVNRPCIIMK